MTATASNSTTYESFTAIGRRSLAGVVMACALGVLQGCSGADALAPETVASVPQPSVVASPEISTIGSDTLVVGESFVVTGAHFPTALGSAQVTVDGVAATVVAQATDRMEVRIEAGALACAPIADKPVVVRMAGKTFEVTRAVRVAHRLAPQVGQDAVQLPAAMAGCVELVASADSSYTRYMLAVVNTSSDQSKRASFSLSGTGTGDLAGAVSTLRSAFAASPAGAEVAAQGGNDQHAHQLASQTSLVAAAPSFGTAWQASNAKAGLRASMAAAKATRNIGDTVTMSALVSGCSAGPSVQARVVYVGSHGVVLEDLRAPRAGRMDATYAQVGEEFDRVVYPLMIAQVGNPLALDGAMGGDGRVTMLFTRVVNDSMPGTAGFVSACNFYPRSTFAGSNQDAVLYGRVPSATESPSDWRRSMRSTVVHETKHLASYAERLARGAGFEEVWLEEATARVAEELYARTFVKTQAGAAFRGQMGYAASVGCEITQCDDRPLVMFKHFSALHDFLRRVDAVPALGATQLNAMTYASGWAFVRWVLDGQSDETTALRALVAGTNGRGLDGMAALTGRDAESLVTGWMADLAGAFDGAAHGQSGSASATWDMRDVMQGLARQLPGAYAESPLRVTRVGFGTLSALTHEVLPMTTHYIAVDGIQRGSQLLSLTTPSGQHVLRLAVARVQ
ncbi:MAG: hypothetical protein IBJ03_01470 [Gemmatimonadaceae bacterium]|nr:hypothetical protein [Gemmatimonadaceae bacterium]